MKYEEGVVLGGGRRDREVRWVCANWIAGRNRLAGLLELGG